MTDFYVSPLPELAVRRRSIFAPLPLHFDQCKRDGLRCDVPPELRATV